MAPGLDCLVACPWGGPHTLTQSPHSPNEAFSSTEMTSLHTFANALPKKSTGLGWFCCQKQCVPDAMQTGLCRCRLAVDGPFGAALTDVFHYPVSVCIAAGIGVTPFAALLKSLWYKCREPQTQPKLNKVWKKIMSSPFHGLKGSASFYLSSANSWGGF